MADAFVSLSSDLPAGLWALLVLGTMLGAAGVLYASWELVFRLVGLTWRRLGHGKKPARHEDGLPQHSR